MADKKIISAELAGDIAGLLNDEKHQVRKGALMVLMQSVQVKENQELFLDKEVVKHLLREFTEEEMEKASLSALIMLSQNEAFRSQVYALNGVLRLLERAQDLVGIMLKKSNIYQTNEVFRKMVADQVQFILLLLSNLLIQEEGADQLLQVDNKDIQGAQLIHLMAYYHSEDPDVHSAFLYFSNILTNLTQFPQVRQKMLDSQVVIFDRLAVRLAEEQNVQRRVQALRTLRNLTFEYETPFVLESIVSPQINYVLQLQMYLLRLAYTFEFMKVDQAFLPLIQHQKYTSNSNYIDEVVTIVDILTTITNVDDVENRCNFDVQLMVHLLTGIKMVYKIKAETKDKIDVVLAIFCKINEFA